MAAMRTVLFLLLACQGNVSLGVRLHADERVELLQTSSELHSKSRSRSKTLQQDAPIQFLIMSSPTYQKVSWTSLSNFKSTEGKALPLIDHGLVEPKGLAYDRKRGFLYVADTGAKRIWQYTILPVMNSQGHGMLTTNGIRVKVLDGHAVEWVTVDDTGNLFYTAPDTNNINKIPNATIDKISTGELQSSVLTILSEKTQEATAMLEAKRHAGNLPHPEYGGLVDKPPAPPHIYSVYEADANPYVSLPASIVADGASLYWTNGQDGQTAGTVVKGEVNPQSQPTPSGPKPFPATPLTNVSDGAFGVAKAHRNLYFTRDGAPGDKGFVSGVVDGSNVSLDVSHHLGRPRGLVWDQDNTVYVADEETGDVFSFPAGAMRADMPLTKAVHMDGAYGLAVLRSDDEGFSANVRLVDSGALSLEEQAQLALSQAGQKSGPIADSVPFQSRTSMAAHEHNKGTMLFKNYLLALCLLSPLGFGALCFSSKQQSPTFEIFAMCATLVWGGLVLLWYFSR